MKTCSYLITVTLAVFLTALGTKAETSIRFSQPDPLTVTPVGQTFTIAWSASGDEPIIGYTLAIFENGRPARNPYYGLTITNTSVSISATNLSVGAHGITVYAVGTNGMKIAVGQWSVRVVSDQHTPPALRITTESPTEVGLEVNGQNHRFYRIQFTESPTEGNWVTVVSETGNGQKTVLPKNGRLGFYRALLIQ